MKPAITFVAVFMCIVSILPSCGNTHIDDELKKDGIKALGKIIDGSGKSGKYSEHFDITVEYQDENGTDLTVSKSITRDEFKSFSKDQKVLLVYSKKNPSIIKILATPEEVLEYTGLKERDMAIADLNALATTKKENVASLLNTVNYGWEKSKDSAWINERKNQYVSVFPELKMVVFVSGPDEYKRFQDLAKQAGLHETAPLVEGETVKKSYENDSLYIGLNMTRDVEKRDIGNEYVPIVTEHEVFLSVITFRKKGPAITKKH
ncbi:MULTISPECIES: hypothetical protein [Niastella]|uniref:DUF4825 domain-containing protein n=1 Tax=Niastella soli TaxID=2821487 RepID=A0ABS3YSQ9_9BACT|nr:hypothetical protein [Niastella soli]MBO9200932.1 hypothetical protein [Niastella soli]